MLEWSKAVWLGSGLDFKWHPKSRPIVHIFEVFGHFLRRYLNGIWIPDWNIRKCLKYRQKSLLSNGGTIWNRTLNYLGFRYFQYSGVWNLEHYCVCIFSGMLFRSPLQLYYFPLIPDWRGWHLVGECWAYQANPCFKPVDPDFEWHPESSGINSSWSSR